MTHSTNSSQSVTAGGLKSEHYPSLELCLRLTEAGFIGSARSQVLGTDKYVCPSVMELLDVFPTEINNPRMYELEFTKNTVAYVHGDEPLIYFVNTLPNALAEMWLWLKENGYLSIK